MPRRPALVGPQSLRPDPASQWRLYFNEDTNGWQVSNGSTWSDLGGGGMAQHANEYHNPDMALADHTHSGVYEPAGLVSTHNGSTNPHALATSLEQTANRGAANGYASLGADGKVPAAQLPAGSDPWTVVRLTGDVSISTTAAGNVTGLYFTPAANKRYLVKVVLLLRTATATVGARPGANFPSGMTDFGAHFEVPNSATTQAYREWGPSTAGQTAAGTGLADTTNSWLATGEAYIVVGASPSGNFQVTLASETAGTNVTCKANSFLMYREIP